MKYHFIAIGGIGMSGLAKYLLEQGEEVSGSDICESKYTNVLKNLGVKIYLGHSENNIPKETCTVVVSSAIKNDNPELLKAKELGYKIYHRSDILAEIAHKKELFIGFAGTHGKTTTSGLASFVLEKANYNPSFVVGGIIPELHTNAQFKNEKYFTAELDESDGTIVKYTPDVVVINNLDVDHIDFYKNGLDDMVKTFNTFVSGLKPDSIVLINKDDTGVSKIICKNITKTYGFSDADYIATNINMNKDFSEFEVIHNTNSLGKFKIQLRGKHNICNALAVIAALNESKVDISKIRPFFEEFTGMGRRFEKVAEFNGITILDDYAHHPTEIKSTLNALRSITDDKIIAVFQPHRYTRFKRFWNEFKSAFDDADRIIVTDVYSASENEIDGITSANFIKEFDNAEYISGSIEEVAKKLLPTLNTNDTVIGLGAGTITNLGKHLKKYNEASI